MERGYSDWCDIAVKIVVNNSRARRTSLVLVSITSNTAFILNQVSTKRGAQEEKKNCTFYAYIQFEEPALPFHRNNQGYKAVALNINATHFRTERFVHANGKNIIFRACLYALKHIEIAYIRIHGELTLPKDY